MNSKKLKSMDGNTAAAHIAYAFSEVCALYPITPSSVMGEVIDEWTALGKKNIFDEVVHIIEMQSEAGAAGAVHGILSGGAFSSTFTASQGLLLMIPNMYKIAGELLPTVFHVSARAIAGQALSIFGDHQDVMATRSTGFCMLCANSVQEVMDMGLVSHLSSIRSSLPFVHFFDGFRTSHEVQKIEEINYEDIKPLVDQESIKRHRSRALSPEHPYLKGSAQNPDIYFQVTEACNQFYNNVPKIVEEEMDKLFKLTGRRYHLFDYVGHEKAETIIIMMGSGAETAEETVNYLVEKGEKVGLVKVRLYRPFSIDSFLKVIPKSVKKIAVLDRTKEVAAFGEPLYLDVCSVLQNVNSNVKVVGGRFGLGSKEFTPSMVYSVFDNLNKKEPKNHFTIGIEDDVTMTSLKIDKKIDPEAKDVVRCKFWGIGGDGTVGANKDAIKIIGNNTDKYVQGYFSYDSKKSSGLTVSHLRFGDTPIKSTYLIETADYIACHHASYVNKYDLLKGIKKGGIFVLNSPWSLEEMEKRLPAELKIAIAQNDVQFYNINASMIANEVGLGGRVNMIMQAVFFKLANIIPFDKAISLLKQAIEKAYKRKGENIILMNQKAVDKALENLQKIDYPSFWKNLKIEERSIENNRPDFIKKVADVINEQKGDELPVSAFVPGGYFPNSTSKYEKRGVATHLAEWMPEQCVQCNLCSLVCPHGAIRPVLLTEEEAKKAPKEYVGLDPKMKKLQGLKFSIEVSPLDCTGCGKCVEICIAKDKALKMTPSEQALEKEKKLWDYCIEQSEKDVDVNKYTTFGSQFKKPLLEFSGACAGCGETPYVKLLTQLYGDRMIISNATGCSSIWGGSAPTIPWTVNEKGYGPAWANSLFEDNAEYGYGIYRGVNFRRLELAHMVKELIDKKEVSEDLSELFNKWIENFNNGDETRPIADEIKDKLKKEKTNKLTSILERQDLFVKPSMWIIGGDGWAYDIGYGGLDHVLSLGDDVNVLVLDTEVYSNTGGQASKSTQLGAIAKFASSGKRTFKKDLGMMVASYNNVYVASVTLGSDMSGVVRALKEAESYKGPSLVIAYASCIAHGIKAGMCKGQGEEKKAVDVGYWFNYRFDPRLIDQNKNPFVLDSKEPTFEIEGFLKDQIRYQYLEKTHPKEAQKLHEELKEHLKRKYKEYKSLSDRDVF